MKNEKWKMKNEKWKMKNERWKMKNEKWKMKNEKWKMKNEKWKMKNIEDQKSIIDYQIFLFGYGKAHLSCCLDTFNFQSNIVVDRFELKEKRIIPYYNTTSQVTGFAVW